VERLGIHGGSLRLFVGIQGAHARQTSVTDLLQQEKQKGISALNYYQGFASRVLEVKRELVTLLLELRRKGKSVAAYGASAKGSTLLNFFGLGRAVLDFAADRSTYKQGRLTPGTHIPIAAPTWLLEKLPELRCS